MITLDQVLLLEKKVETAVAKIEQLKAENDALRSKCAELTNALEAKTELVSSFESDQNKIEEGILSALSKLSEIENSVLDISETQTENAEQTEDAPAQENQTQESQVQPHAETEISALNPESPVQETAQPSQTEENEFIDHFDPPSQETQLEPQAQNPDQQSDTIEASANSGDSEENKNLFDIF